MTATANPSARPELLGPAAPTPEHPVLVVLGTRPEVIKLAPVIRAFRERGVPARLLSTGQHREMLEQGLASFGLVPDADLRVMRADQTLAGLSAALLTAIDPVLDGERPSWVVLQGDTTTVAMVGLAAFYRRIPVAHVEAGLRTYDRYDPFPEEMNRTLLGSLAELHLAPTPEARENLLRQGVAPERIHVVGNTVVDALRQMEAIVAGRSLADLGLGDLAPVLGDDGGGGRDLVLVTGHRRESFGAGLRNLCLGLRRIAEEHGERVLVLYPVHLNPNVRAAAHEILAGVPNVRLTEPLEYPAFVKLMTRARLIVTDSGGIQEEAASLGVPVLVTRWTSERQEAIRAGVAELVGTDPQAIAGAARRLLGDPAAHAARAVRSDVFGDGRAAQRIVELLLAHST